MTQAIQTEVELLLVDNRTNDALALLNSGLNRHPSSPDLLCLRSSILHKLNLNDAALRDAKASLMGNPTFVKGYIAQAAAQQALGMTTDALATVERAMVFDPSDSRLGLTAANLRSMLVSAEHGSEARPQPQENASSPYHQTRTTSPPRSGRQSGPTPVSATKSGSNHHSILIASSSSPQQSSRTPAVANDVNQSNTSPSRRVRTPSAFTTTTPSAKQPQYRCVSPPRSGAAATVDTSRQQQQVHFADDGEDAASVLASAVGRPLMAAVAVSLQNTISVDVTRKLFAPNLTLDENERLFGLEWNRTFGLSLKISVEVRGSVDDTRGSLAIPSEPVMDEFLHHALHTPLHGKFLNDEVAYFLKKRCAPTLEHIALAAFDMVQKALTSQFPTMVLVKVKVKHGTHCAKVKAEL